ncbi:hypothetical protein Tco_1065363 [Tanacetum coccineum]
MWSQNDENNNGSKSTVTDNEHDEDTNHSVDNSMALVIVEEKTVTTPRNDDNCDNSMALVVVDSIVKEKKQEAPITNSNVKDVLDALSLFTTLPTVISYAAQKLKKEQDDGSNEPYLPSSLMRHAAQKLKKEQDDGSNKPYKAVLQLHKLSHTVKGRFRTREIVLMIVFRESASQHASARNHVIYG